jgi:hypothetical protein
MKTMTINNRFDAIDGTDPGEMLGSCPALA